MEWSGEGGSAIKVLDVKQLHSELEQTTADLTRLMEQIKQIQMKVDGFVGMDDAFKGKAANSIRVFYQESHIPLLVFMEGFIADFQDALDKIKSSLASLEPDEQGYIHEAFLQEDVKKGLKNAENVTMSLTDEANRVISSVGDILSLASVNDSDFLDQAQRARKKVDLTLENLYTFDSESTRALDRPQNDLDVMQTYIDELGGMVSRGEISIGNYSVQQLSQHNFHQALISEVRGKAFKNMLNLDVLIGLGATNILSRFVPYAGSWANMLAEKFEMKTVEYSFRALNVVAASVGSNISEQEFATVKGQVVNTAKVSDYQGEWYGNYLTLIDGRILREYMDQNGNLNYQFVSAIPESRLKPEEEEKNPFQKTVSSFGEIGSDIWSGLTERGNKATDSWYDFGNYLTLGALDLGKDAYAGLQYNAENMTNSPKDFANWATMGAVDMVEAAVNPEEAFSKEHWMASFGVVLTGAGVRGVNTPRNKGVSNTNSRVKSPDQKRTVPATQMTSTTPKLPTLTNIREWYRVNVPEVGLVQDSMGGYHFAVNRGGGGSKVVSSGTGKNNKSNYYVKGNTNDILQDGSHITKNGKLKPNARYQTGEYNYQYRTDNSGRITEFNTNDLNLTKRENRLPHKNNTLGKEPGDHSGHLAADRFGGSPDLDNLVSQSSSVNLSKYKKLENQWAQAIQEGKSVSVNVKVNYEGNSLRPDSFDIDYEIDGRSRFVTIQN